MSLDLPDVLKQVIAIAHGAGEIVMRHFAEPIPTSLKSSRIDVVTAADKAAEAYITRELARLYPADHIVGEEGGGQGAPATSAPYHWFVDPIDGTVNFAGKLPHFCTSIALATADRRPLVGVVYDPNRRETFTAIRGGGARLNDRPIKVTETSELIDAIVSSGFPYDRQTNPDNNLQEWSTFVMKIRGERRLGSAALDLAYTAAGRLDGYWEKRLNPWDVMAGVLLVEEAGGTATGLSGEPNPVAQDRISLVASNGRLQAAMLEVLRAAGR